jgi:hypothetical protein
MPSMKRFTLTRLLLSITAIAAGLGMFAFMMSRKINPRASPDEWREPPRFDRLGVTLWFLSGAIVGATCFSFVKPSWKWAACGAGLGAFLMLVLRMKA